MKIVLAHGVLGFGVLGPLEYFNGIAGHIESAFRGVTVTPAHVNPIGNIDERAKQLAPQIANAARGEKVHIFAHSMGGMDARHAIARIDGVAAHVATLVTIGTPHLGSPVADGIESGHVKGVERLALPIVLELQLNQPALHDLTTHAAKDFDAATHDNPNVRYLCVAGDATSAGAHESLPFRALAAAFGLSGRHDGVVPFDSATRGGKSKPIAVWPTDHAGEIGWNLDRLLPVALPFADRSHLERYAALVKLLS